MSSYHSLPTPFKVESSSCHYTETSIISDYVYETTSVEGNVVRPVKMNMQFKTETVLPKLGVMLVGLGGNNGWYVSFI